MMSLKTNSKFPKFTKVSQEFRDQMRGEKKKFFDEKGVYMNDSQLQKYLWRAEEAGFKTLRTGYREDVANPRQAERDQLSADTAAIVNEKLAGDKTVDNLTRVERR